MGNVGKGTKLPRGIVEEMLLLWPGLPLLSYGLWMTWSVVAFDGSIWLSDVETNGISIVRLYIESGLAFSLACIAFGCMPPKVRALVDSPALIISAGTLSVLGCLMIILAGPYYLGGHHGLDAVLFDVGAVMCGIGNAVVALRIGVLYGSLPPRKALLYAGLSQILICSVYCLAKELPQWAPVAGGPSLVGVCAFVLLPLASALLACLESSLTKSRPAPGEYELSIRALPSAFAKLCVVSALLAFSVGLIRSYVVGASDVESVLQQGGLVLLMRIAIACVVVAVALKADFSRIDFGRTCTWLSIAIVVFLTGAVVVEEAAIGLSAGVYAAGMVFELVMWLVLVFYVYQKRMAPVVVFGIGRGFFMLAGVLGWAVGSYALPAASEVVPVQHVFAVTAAVLIIASFALFSEGTFSRLFSPIHEADLTLSGKDDVAQQVACLPESDPSALGRSEEWVDASVESLAQSRGLTPREKEVLRLLASGKGSNDIADELCVSWNTVRSHTHSIYNKLDVHSKGELMGLVLGFRN